MASKEGLPKFEVSNLPREQSNYEATRSDLTEEQNKLIDYEFNLKGVRWEDVAFLDDSGKILLTETLNQFKNAAPEEQKQLAKKIAEILR